ncbi:MAG: hypothetical protein IJU29_06725 [Oscillospiraceae bacterium]|nr:hypothetical protein [Oscillospiraceae bacterium]
MVQTGITEDGEFPEYGAMSVWLPVALYEIEKTDDYVHTSGKPVLMSEETPFQASITHVDQSASVTTTADGFSFVVDDTTELNRIMFNGSEAKGTYDIQFSSTFDGEHDEIQITGDIMAQLMTFAMINGEAETNAESLVSIRSCVVNGVSTGSDSISGNAAAIVSFSPNGGSGNMSSRKASEDGSFTLPLCDFKSPISDRSFAGWLYQNELLQPGATIYVAEDAVVFAQWTEDDISIQGIVIDGNVVTVTLSGNVSETCTLVVASYSDGEKMIGAVAADAVSGSTSVTLNTGGAKYLKAFLVDSKTQSPICESLRRDLT